MVTRMRSFFVPVQRVRRAGLIVLRAAPTVYLRWSFLLLGLLVLLIVTVFVVGVGTGPPPGAPIEGAWRTGLERLTGGRFTVNRPDAVALAVVIVFLVRRARLDWLTIRPGPVEVRPLEDSSLERLDEQRLRRLNVELREALAGAQLYETTSVPGDLETERIFEVFREASGGGRLAMLGAVWAFLWPTRAFVVTPTLRTRPEEPSYGVSVTVRRLPHPGVELDPQWAEGFERALQRAAFAVTAHIVPQTRACDRPPWGQWRDKSTDKVMPTDLMRHYQVAKRLVAERRYDEALTVYQYALLHDTDNVYMQYDMGQIFERLHLYPDAMRIYSALTERLFPLLDRADGTRGRSWAYTRRALLEDPFMVRYRYVQALTTGSQLARELLAPDWDLLREWLARDHQQRRNPQRPPRPDRHLRPFRATELGDLRSLLGTQFDRAWLASLPPAAALAGHGLTGLLGRDPDADTVPEFLEAERLNNGWWGLNPRDLRVRAAEEYFLHVAGHELDSLLADFRRHLARRRWRSSHSGLTVVTLELMGLLIVYRKRRFRPRGAFPEVAPHTWPPPLEQMRADLAAAGYREESPRWLEHYVAACYYALPLQDDQAPRSGHRSIAEAAVQALDRAQQCGDDIEFVTSKRYWLLAGDPDLIGLRQYDCFLAFESRVYLHPQPTAADPAKYEMFHYMRLGLAQGAEVMERLWRERAGKAPSALEFESWFRQERRAWEVLVRLGRFHRQWQTRSAALDSLRRLGRYAGTVPSPTPYPEIVRGYYNVGAGTPDQSRRRIEGMEEVLAFLAQELGPAAAIDPEEAQPQEPVRFGEAQAPEESDEPLRDLRGQERVFAAPVIPNTRAWIWHAEYCSRTALALPEAEFTELCRARAAVWAALRQRVTTPARRTDEAFIAAVRRLPVPTTPEDGPVIVLPDPRPQPDSIR